MGVGDSKAVAPEKGNSANLALDQRAVDSYYEQQRRLIGHVRENCIEWPTIAVLPELQDRGIGKLITQHVGQKITDEFNVLSICDASQRGLPLYLKHLYKSRIVGHIHMPAKTIEDGTRVGAIKELPELLVPVLVWESRTFTSSKI